MNLDWKQGNADNVIREYFLTVYNVLIVKTKVSSVNWLDLLSKKMYLKLVNIAMPILMSQFYKHTKNILVIVLGVQNRFNKFISII